MRTMIVSAAFCLLATFIIGLSGCGKGNTNPPTAGEPAPVAHRHAHDHGHGPHEGHVIGLDHPSFHAELVHDENSHRVGIHMLGEDAATAAPIEAASVMISVSADGQTTEYTLPAVAQPSEAAGKSSYFELANEPLLLIVSGGSPSPSPEVQLTVTIDDKPYVGFIDASIHQHGHAAVHSHSHADDDTLVWRKELRELGYDIALGHHGATLLAGADVEPAVQITRDGQPVADAQVYNALLAADGETVLADEVATVYEPPTDDEPAHYAQGALKIPPGTRESTIRYRIILPEGQGEHTFDVPIAVR